MIQLDIELNIELNAKDKYGKTAFNWACFKGYLEVTEILIQKSAEFNIELNIKKNIYYGLEPSNKMFQKAKTKLLDKNLYNLNLENFNHKIKFDYIWFLWNVIGHVNDADTFFLKKNLII